MIVTRGACCTVISIFGHRLGDTVLLCFLCPLGDNEVSMFADSKQCLFIDDIWDLVMPPLLEFKHPAN